MGAPWRCWQQVPPLFWLYFHSDTATCTLLRLVQAVYCVKYFIRVWKAQQVLQERKVESN